MIERKLSGQKPKIRLPKGTVDTQMHMYMPGFPAVEGGPPLPGGTLPGPDEYRRLMDWLGIDRVVITQGNAHQADNANLYASLAEMGDVARGVAVISGETSEAELKRLHEAGVRGARIMDLPGGAVGLDGLPAVDDLAHAMGWCIAVQFDGSHILDHMDLLEGLKSRFIVDHHGKFFSGVTPDSPQVAAVKRLIDRGNCWFKFAACYEFLEVRRPGLRRHRGRRARHGGPCTAANRLGHQLAAQHGQDHRGLSGRRGTGRHGAFLGAGRGGPQAHPCRQPAGTLRLPRGVTSPSVPRLRGTPPWPQRRVSQPIMPRANRP